TASQDNMGGSGVAGYKVYRGGVLLGTASNVSYTDSGLSAATSYSYTVSAYDGTSPPNESAPTAPAAAMTQGGAAPLSIAIHNPPPQGVWLNGVRSPVAYAFDVAAPH